MTGQTLILDGNTRDCAWCGQSFTRASRLSAAQWAKRLYCGRNCSGRASRASNATKRGSLHDAFSQRFAKGPGCWNWRGTLDGYGYGVLDYNFRRYRAHVLSLLFDGRPVGPGQVARHHCDNPSCVRPDHLCPGSPAENARDAMERGRLARGETHKQAKLNAETVKEIRSSSETNTFLSQRFGVSRVTIARVRSGLTWRHIL